MQQRQWARKKNTHNVSMTYLKVRITFHTQNFFFSLCAPNKCLCVRAYVCSAIFSFSHKTVHHTHLARSNFPFVLLQQNIHTHWFDECFRWKLWRDTHHTSFVGEKCHSKCENVIREWIYVEGSHSHTIFVWGSNEFVWEEWMQSTVSWKPLELIKSRFFRL